MNEEHYLTEDSILPDIDLPIPCEIRIDISEEYVKLTIGQRDFGWVRGHPDLNGAGTANDLINAALQEIGALAPGEQASNDDAPWTLQELLLAYLRLSN